MDQKQILYFDMDGVLADFNSGVSLILGSEKKKCEGHVEDAPVLYSQIRPIRGAQRAVEILSGYYDVRALTSMQWDKPSVLIDKLEWLKRYFGNTFRDKLILTTDKSHVLGYALIDNGINDRSGRFCGRIIWLNLPDQPGYCDSQYEYRAEECRSWYDVCQRLITARSGDETWKGHESDLWYE